MTPMIVQCSSCLTEFELDPEKVPANGVRARCSVCSAVIVVPSPRSAPATAEPPTTPTPAPTPAPIRAPAPAAPAAAPVAAPVAAHTAPPAHPQWTAAPAQPAVEAPAAAPTAATHEPPPVAPAQIEHAERDQPRFTPPRVDTFKPAPAASAPAAPPSEPATRSAWIVPERPLPGHASPSHAAPASEGFGTPHPEPEGQRRSINPFLTRDPALRAKRLARALVSDIVAYHPARHAEGLRDGTLKTLFRDEIKKSYEEYVDQVGRDFAGSTTHFQDALNDVLASGKKLF